MLNFLVKLNQKSLSPQVKVVSFPWKMLCLCTILFSPFISAHRWEMEETMSGIDPWSVYEAQYGPLNAQKHIFELHISILS